MGVNRFHTPLGNWWRTSDKIQKYGDWRKKHPAQTVYVGKQPMTHSNQHYVIRTKTRSVSPTRSPQMSPGYTRGRSTERQFVYTVPRSTNNGRRHLRVIQPRSRSAPPPQRKGTEIRNSQPLPYTKEHYLAIKQPFTKRYLLPPVKLYNSTGMPPVREVVSMQRALPTRPLPQPSQQQIQHSTVYHVKYETPPNQIVHRGQYDYRGQNVIINTPQHYEGQNQVVYRQHNSEGYNTVVNTRPRYEYLEPHFMSADDMYINTRTYQNDPVDFTHDYDYQTTTITPNSVKNHPKSEVYTIIDYVDPPNVDP